MKRSENFYTMACSLFVMALVLPNVLSSKIIVIRQIQITAGTICYALTYLATDVIGEFYGEERARYVVKSGFICLVVMPLIVASVVAIPAPNSESFNVVMNQSARVTIASVISYIISQNIDVFLFDTLKKHFPSLKWLRNNVATITSQFIDTSLFCFIAFYGVTGNIFMMIAGVYLAKCIIALLDTPFFLFVDARKYQRRQCLCCHICPQYEH